MEQLAGDLRACGGVAVGDGHADEIEVGRLQRKPERPRIVDIAADVGVEDHLEAAGVLRAGEGNAEDERGGRAKSGRDEGKDTGH